MIKKNIFPFLFIFLVTCLIFFKIFLKGLYPIPGDLLVSFYFPWYSGGWDGYNPWTTHKELLGADSIRQIYIWKDFAADQFKKGQIPLWNPYTLSGQPLIANFQSSVFYPLNIFYFLIDSKNAWILLVVSQPFLGGIFMYIAIRSLNLSKSSSLFGAIAFMFSSYLITWMENGNISHSYIWLPLAFFSVIKYFEKKKFRYLLLLIISLSLAILAGHPQTAIYVYLFVFIFWIFKSYDSKSHVFKSISTLFLATTLSLTLSAIQLIPTYDFYKESPISLPFSRAVFDKSILPYQNLITFFASDFFGHPAANNFWSQTYGDFTPYFGVIPLVFSLWAIFKLRNLKLTKFLAITSFIFIISAVAGPITFLIKTFRIPLLDSTTPSRFISISIFLLITLSAFGFNDFLMNLKNTKYQKLFLKFLLLISTIYIFLWAFATLGIEFLTPKETWQVNLAVTRRNLILPTSMFLLVVFLAFCLAKFKKIRELGASLVIIILFLTTLVGGVYFSNKFLPVSPKKFIFPSHPLFFWLQENAGIDRFYGGGTAHIDFNYPTIYKIYGAEGYDTLRFKRYAELLASGFSGNVPSSYLRSDAVFDNVENGYRKRLFELLGVKYLLDKEDNPKSEADWHYERLPNDKVKGYWQESKFQVYIRENTLPRVFLTDDYTVIKDDKEIIRKIYDQNFNLETLILEKEPPITILNKSSTIQIPRIIKYDPNELQIRTNTNNSSLLFISDTYSKDWQAFIDNQEAPILRTHYALRSIAVPAGTHDIFLIYKPKSFEYGLYLTLATAIFLVTFSFTKNWKKVF